MAFIRFAGNITDDAGKRVKLLDPAGMCEWPSKGDERIDSLVVRVRQSMAGWSLLESGLSLGLTLLIIVVLFSLRPLVNRVWPANPSCALFLCILGVGCIVTRFLWRARLQAHASQVRDLVLAEGLCPCCGYNFAGLNIEEKGAEVLIPCPECGSTWRRDRIERLIPFDKSLPTSVSVARFIKRESVSSWSELDDRGARVNLVHPGVAAPIRTASGDHRVRLKSARAVIRQNRAWVRIILAVMFVLFGGWAFVLGFGDGGSSGLMMGILGAAICLAFAALILGANCAYSPRFVRQTMLSHQLCPTCGTDLARLTPEPRDGCVRCEACRSAWRVAPPTEAP